MGGVVAGAQTWRAIYMLSAINDAAAILIVRERCRDVDRHEPNERSSRGALLAPPDAQLGPAARLLGYPFALSTAKGSMRSQTLRLAQGERIWAA